MRKSARSAGAALAIAGTILAPVAQAKTLSCASATEVSAIQVAVVKQELYDATLSCGPAIAASVNAFITRFRPELTRSDATLMAMFKRLNGASKGNAEYDAFKTRAINHAEQRRLKPGGQESFCATANAVLEAGMASDKPALNDFVSGILVEEANPVESCEIKVAMTLQGVQADPGIAPTPRPDLPGDPPNPGLFPQ
jgi:hypothetical protein